MNRGKFIVIDGVDGSGKTTILDLLTQKLTEESKNFILVKDPSPTVAQEIRNILLGIDGLEPSTRLYLYLAARSELLYKQIIPALDEGKIVICDRYNFSTYAYQGVYFTKEQIDVASKIGGLDKAKPDLQLVFINKKSFRSSEEEDVMGQYCNNFRNEIIEKYKQLANTYPDLNAKIISVDGLTVEEVFSQVKQFLSNVI